MKEAVEAGLRDCDGTISAMNVLGGGAYSVDESASYVKSFDAVKKYVIGAAVKVELQSLSPFLICMSPL